MVAIPFVEQDCTITHEGRRFEFGGAVVTDDSVVAYVGKDPDGTLIVTDWHGNKLGTCAYTSSWRVQSFIADRMYQIIATIDGKRYTGRGMGQGMVCKLRRIARS